MTDDLSGRLSSDDQPPPPHPLVPPPPLPLPLASSSFLALPSFCLLLIFKRCRDKDPGCCGETGAQDAVRSGDAGQVMNPAGGLLTGCAFITI